MIERQIDIDTRDGAMGTFICHPERAGQYPVVLFLMDAPGIREELRDMARRLGTVGYYVMLPNLYYRTVVEELGSVVGEQNLATRTRALQLMTTIDIPQVMEDVDALIAFAAADRNASPGPIGCMGYCMSGRYAINAARRHQRVRAAASLYGTQLVTDRSDSPHLVASQVQAHCYFACAEQDTYMPPDRVAVLQASVRDAANVEVELYPGLHHGFAFASRPAVYDKAGAERHWERLFHLFGTTLARD